LTTWFTSSTASRTRSAESFKGRKGPEGAQSLSGRHPRCGEQVVRLESVVPLG
jgi:hypothetical protein